MTRTATGRGPAWKPSHRGSSPGGKASARIGGLLSHQLYRNYTSLIEAELAVLQDLGYAIDRGKYYGFSVYGDGRTLVNTRGYAARNAAGTGYLAGVYSRTALGVGLHLYGSHNTVVQAADILTAGAGAAGIRVDGADNTVVIAPGTAVRADGRRGVGVLAAYGSGHRIRQDGAVTADGAGGVGVRFDFGSNVLGGDEYRGSYIRYYRLIDSNGVIAGGGNFLFDDSNVYYQAAPELDGPLVEAYDLRGYLSGEQNAVYIGKNAFVRQINILDHAVLRGDITSDWKHFAMAEAVYGRLAERPAAAEEIWATAQKGWNALDDGADGLGEVKDHVWRIAIGKDRRIGAHGIIGGAFGYGKHSAAQGASSGTAGDYRAALRRL